MKKKTICIVEDNPELSKLLRDILPFEMKGWKVRIFSTAEALLKTMPGDLYPVYILDCEIGGKGNPIQGPLAAKRIRKKHKDSIIIGMSAYIENRDDFEQVGVPDFWNKMTSTDDLVEKINALLEKTKE